jgi:hypothetical protein
MHFAYFESLPLKLNDKITFTVHAGNIHTGYYKGNYNKEEGTFRFLGSKPGSEVETVSLRNVQIFQKIDDAPHTQLKIFNLL